jgi:DNA-binding LacI/PurR family transcriptional regulator
MVALADVARVAGVSTATVSRVINGHPSVRDETRIRVEAAMQALSYRMSVAARSLRTAQTRMVLALVPDFANPYYAEIVRGLGAAAREHDYELLLCDTGVSEARERAVAQMLTRRMYDGVVCMDPYTTQRMVSAEVRALPWVACSEFVPDEEIPHVSVDHRLAAKDAVLYLLGKGHRRIALINSDERYLYAQQRRDGYRDALRDAGLAERADYIQIVGGIDHPLGELAARRLLALDEPPTAVFAVSDTLAVGAIKATLAAGRAVPGDLAVVGFDDVPLASIFEPSLTTVAQPRRELGQQAMELLMKRIAGERPASVTLAHALVVRRSA